MMIIEVFRCEDHYSPSTHVKYGLYTVQLIIHSQRALFKKLQQGGRTLNDSKHCQHKTEQQS